MGNSAPHILAELALREIAAGTTDPWARREAERVLEAIAEPEVVELELPNGRRQLAELAPFACVPDESAGLAEEVARGAEA